MAELGTTSDPTELVPGNPAAIDGNVRVLRARSEQAQLAGDGLLAIDTGAWTGQAANTFRDKFSYEPGKWFSAADALETAATALSDYAAMLRTAQSRASEAIAAWDAGDGRHDEARDILGRARESLSTAGYAAARTIAKRADTAPAKSDWIDDLTHLLGSASAAAINGAASLGNSLLNHPMAAGAAVAGLGLAAVSAAGFGGGTVLDATGVGAVAGVPVQAASAAGMATGAGIVAAATAEIIDGAMGDDQVEVIDDAAFSNTKHGDERLLERGFTDDDIVETKSAGPIKQADGADVFIKQNANGRYDVIVEGDRGVVTALKGLSEKSLNRLAKNYRWEGF